MIPLEAQCKKNNYSTVQATKHIVLQLLLTHQLVIIVDALHFKIVVGLY